MTATSAECDDAAGGFAVTGGALFSAGCVGLVTAVVGFAFDGVAILVDVGVSFCGSDLIGVGVFAAIAGAGAARVMLAILIWASGVSLCQTCCLFDVSSATSG